LDRVDAGTQLRSTRRAENSVNARVQSLAGEMFKTIAGVINFTYLIGRRGYFLPFSPARRMSILGPLLSSIEYVRAGNFAPWR
jgi:hypothetical protein